MHILDAFRLDGKVALVTGVGRGIGQAVALALAEAGADIAGVYRSSCEETQARVETLGRRFLPIPCDLHKASLAELEQVVQRVVQEWGHLDILVNAAGTVWRGLALEIDEAGWDDVLQVNLKALFFLSRAAARVMKQQGGGKIIHIASIMAFQGGVRIPSYAASKSGVAGVTRAMANEWAPFGIHVNAIAPGYTQTDLTSPLWKDPEQYQALLSRIPAGRWARPEDMKGAIVFLASAASDYVHGVILPVDGGWLAR
ncbi:MAG: SDR family oxidoreductase [Anaerolineae bacterium]